MGQHTSTPHRRSPGGVSSAARRCVSSRGASAEGGSVVYDRHRKSRRSHRRRAVQDRTGKWCKIPKPRLSVQVVVVENGPSSSAAHDKTTIGCWWQAVAAGIALKACQLEIRCHILSEFALKTKLGQLQQQSQEINSALQTNHSSDADAQIADHIQKLRAQVAPVVSKEMALKMKIPERKRLDGPTPAEWLLQYITGVEEKIKDAQAQQDQINAKFRRSQPGRQLQLSLDEVDMKKAELQKELCEVQRWADNPKQLLEVVPHAAWGMYFGSPANVSTVDCNVSRKPKEARSQAEEEEEERFNASCAGS